MKVLRIHTEYNKGGASVGALMLHNEINAFPDSEDIFAHGKGEKVKGDPRVVRFAIQAEVLLHAFITRISGIQGCGTYFSTNRLLRLVDRWQPDLIHFHNIHGYYIDFSVAKRLKGLSIPVVWTIHDGWSLTGRCVYLRGCKKWMDGCGSCPDLAKYPRTYYDSSKFMWKRKRRLLGNDWSPVLVSPSNWLGSILAETISNKCDIRVIPNGVDKELFNPGNQIEIRSKLGTPLDRKIILFLASDLKNKEKGAKYFFESLEYVKSRNFMVLTVGRKIDLSRIVKEGIDIVQMGYVENREDLANIYASSDIFCTTSLEENFPRVVLEAMSSGTPVVGFNVGGISEQLKSDCGLLANPFDVKTLAGMIDNLLEDDKKREFMSRRCRERVIAEYGNELFVKRYINLYEELIGG